MIGIWDIIMTVAAFGFTLSAVPQITLLHCVKKAEEVSLLRNVIIMTCVALTIVADYGLELWFAFVMNTIQLLLCSTVITQVIYYRRKSHGN